MIVHCVPKTLFASEVTLCRLDRNVTEQELDLLQFTTSFVAELRARSPKIMGRYSRQTAIRGGLFHNGPDHFRCETRTPDAACLVDRSK